MDVLIGGRTQAERDAIKACELCGEVFKSEGITTGYGIRSDDGKKVCYACCALDDIRQMREDGRATLYLTRDAERVKAWHGLGVRTSYNPNAHVGNWPGSLKFPVVHMRLGHHNIAGTRYDVWFRDMDNNLWWGVQYGEWTQIVHCKRIKSAAQYC